MPVPANLASRRVYHFTHVENLRSVLAKGLLARRHRAFPIVESRSVANMGLQSRRALVRIPCGPGGQVHDYVPLYFGSRSPMLYSITHDQGINQSDLVYFEFSIDLVERPEVVFTRASAHTIGDDGFFSDPAKLEELDWAAIDIRDPDTPDSELRHRRMAEVLVYRELSIREAVVCIAFDEVALLKVKGLLEPDCPIPVGLQSPERIHWF